MTEQFDTSGEDAYPLPVPLGGRRMAILADGCFSPLGAKTAVCLVRYVPNEVVTIIDSTRSPGTVERALGFGGDIPIVASLAEALARKPNTFVLGTAPRGGTLTGADRAVVLEAVRAGLHIASGMHDFLADDPEIALLARERGIIIWDARKPPQGLGVSSGKACPHCPVILTVGSDCNTGKMTVAMETHLALLREGVRSAFAASGQTGIMIAGRGIAVDRVIADFIGGATERLVCETAPGHDVVLLEGQGSILHPGYAGVTYGMIAGSLPRGLILCHQPSRKFIRNYDVPIPPLPRLVELYEGAIAGLMKLTVIGIALNTFDLDEGSARAAALAASRETGLPVTDPVRTGAAKLVRAVRRHLSL